MKGQGEGRVTRLSRVRSTQGTHMNGKALTVRVSSGLMGLASPAVKVDMLYDHEQSHQINAPFHFARRQNEDVSSREKVFQKPSVCTLLVTGLQLPSRLRN